MIGSNGLPLANRRPAPACASASAKVHSAWEVGLLSGITIGRQLSSAIFCAVEEPLDISVCYGPAVFVCRGCSAANLASISVFE